MHALYHTNEYLCQFLGFRRCQETCWWGKSFCSCWNWECQSSSSEGGRISSRAWTDVSCFREAGNTRFQLNMDVKLESLKTKYKIHHWWSMRSTALTIWTEYNQLITKLFYSAVNENTFLIACPFAALNHACFEVGNFQELWVLHLSLFLVCKLRYLFLLLLSLLFWFLTKYLACDFRTLRN